jgi:hypothetical protein
MDSVENMSVQVRAGEATLLAEEHQSVHRFGHDEPVELRCGRPSVRRLEPPVLGESRKHQRQRLDGALRAAFVEHPTQLGKVSGLSDHQATEPDDQWPERKVELPVREVDEVAREDGPSARSGTRRGTLDTMPDT